jgi:hypothetical protein
MQTKLKIAEMDQQTEIMKVQANLQHETNTLMFKEELAEMREKSKSAHELITDVHRHLLIKDEMETKANLQHETNVIKGVVDHHVKSVGAPVAPLATTPMPSASLHPSEGTKL